MYICVDTGDGVFEGTYACGVGKTLTEALKNFRLYGGEDDAILTYYEAKKIDVNRHVHIEKRN